MDANSLISVRLRLKAQGYDPIPLKIDKKPYLNWPKMPNGEAEIRQWGRWFGCIATGIRLYGSRLLVLDLDITLAPLRDAVLRAWTERWPEFMAGCVRRHSGGVSLALIGQCATNRGTLKSRRWASPDEKDQLVEVFTRHSKRFLVVDGAHSPGRTYGYSGRPLWEVAPTQLPEFPADDLGAMLGAADEVMGAAGLEQKQAAILGKYLVYDLQADMEIVLADGEVTTLGELEQAFRRGPTVTARAYPTPWDLDSTSARVLATLGRDGLCLWDTKTETSHRWAWRKPPESLAAMAAQLRALKGEKS